MITTVPQATVMAVIHHGAPASREAAPLAPGASSWISERFAAFMVKFPPSGRTSRVAGCTGSVALLHFSPT